MTDLELSKALALAIGYAFTDVYYHGPLDIELRDKCVIHVQHEGKWRDFDYRDWNVIGPIAEKFDCFPTQGVWGEWHSSYRQCAGSVQAGTPQKAIALAVIGGAG